jgi:hypothetical protein
MLRSFFPAAAISTPFPMMLASLSQIVIKPQAIAAFQISPEFRALLIQSERHFYGMSAIESMEEDYAARLLSMRKDVAHWEMLQPKSPLIDWPLLCLWVAILRSNRGMELPAPRNDAAEFIRWLARELARREP